MTNIKIGHCGKTLKVLLYTFSFLTRIRLEDEVCSTFDGGQKCCRSESRHDVVSVVPKVEGDAVVHLLQVHRVQMTTSGSEKDKYVLLQTFSSVKFSSSTTVWLIQMKDLMCHLNTVFSSSVFDSYKRFNYLSKCITLKFWILKIWIIEPMLTSLTYKIYVTRKVKVRTIDIIWCLHVVFFFPCIS